MTTAAAVRSVDVTTALGWMAQLVVDDEGTRWGDTAAGYQMVNAAEILDQTAEVRQFFVPGTRGARKTTDLAALALALLENQAPAYAKGFFIASDEDQAMDIVEVAAEMVARTPGMGDLFEVRGKWIRHLRTGASFTALANDPSAMGKRPWFIVADELSNWPQTKAARKFWTAMTTATEKVPGCRLVVLTNAGSPDHWAFKRFETAKASAHWRVLDIPAPLPWHDEATLARSRENCLTEAEYLRLFMNVWTDEDSRLTSLEQVPACVSNRHRPIRRVPGVRYVAGLDVGWVNDRSVLVVAHLEPRAQRLSLDLPWTPIDESHPRAHGEGQLRPDLLWTVVVDDLQVWQGRPGAPVDLSEVEQAATDTARYYRAALVYDPRELVAMGQRVQRQGVVAQPYVFTQGSKTVLATTMIRLFREQALDLPDDAELIDELVHVNVRENAQGFVRLDHDSGRHDDRAVALALAAQHLLAGTRAEERRHASTVRVVSQDRWSHGMDRTGRGAGCPSDRDRIAAMQARLAELGGGPSRLTPSERAVRVAGYSR